MSVNRLLPLSAQLRGFFARLDPHFKRAEPREHAFAYLCSLLSHTPPDATLRNDGRNRLLTTARWSEDAVRDEVRRIVGEKLAASASVLVIAEAAFVKKGNSSAGVARQYCASTGRVENVQLGLFLLQSDAAGSVGVIDRELYLPRLWAEDPVRRRHAGIPDWLPAHSRQQLALAMLDRTLAAGASVGWVTAVDPALGDDETFRAALEERRLPYVLPGTHAPRPPSAPRVPQGFNRWHGTRWGGGSYHGFGPRSATAEDLSLVVNHAGLAARGLTAARSDAGLDRYSVRKWRAWYRHMTLAMAAQAFLLVSGPRLARAPHAALAPPAPRTTESAESLWTSAEYAATYQR